MINVNGGNRFVTIALYVHDGDSKRSTIYDKIISGWQWLFSKDKLYNYTHVELIIDGKFCSSSARDGGVRYKEIDPYSGHWHFIRIPAIENSQIDTKKFIRKTLGDKYDWLGIFFGQLTVFNIQDKKRWFCDEFVGTIIKDHYDVKLSKVPNRHNVASLTRDLLKFPNNFILTDMYGNILTLDKQRGGLLGYFKR